MAGMKQQRGMALVIVLLIVAVVSLIAVEMTAHLQRETRRSGNMFAHAQAQEYALGLERRSLGMLTEHFKDSPSKDNLGQAWATQGLMFPVEGGLLTGAITDVNSCFNVNSLVTLSAEDKPKYVGDPEGVAYLAYQRLLQLLELDAGLADALVDWLDSDDHPLSLDGAEDMDYALQLPPYRAANNLMADISEMRLLAKYTPEIVAVLLPHLCALPEAGYLKMNVNTIAVEQPALLSMWLPELPLTEATAILTARAPEGYETIEAFWTETAIPIESRAIGGDSVLQLDSDYFKLSATAQIGRGQVRLSSLFKQQENGSPSLVWRQFGGQ